MPIAGCFRRHLSPNYTKTTNLHTAQSTKKHSINLWILKLDVSTPWDRAEQRYTIVRIINACKNKAYFILILEESPWKKIFLPVCALVHFSVSWAYSFIYDLHLVLKYSVGRGNIFFFWMQYLSWILSFWLLCIIPLYLFAKTVLHIKVNVNMFPFKLH